MSVAVTGGAGYIGSHAVKALRAAGADVVIYDNLSAGHRAAAEGAAAPLEIGDIHDLARLREVFEARRVDAVMHFAASLSVSESVADPFGYYENNVAGALAVLRAMAETGDHRPEVHVIPRAIDAALGRATFAMFGTDYETPDGTCLRDYVHVTDLASAHLLALESLRAGGPSAAYNLCNGRPTSVREVVESVERVTGRTVPVTVGDRRPGDPAVLFASSDRIKRDLGWSPTYEALDVIVETAWRWRAAHPNGYED